MERKTTKFKYLLLIPALFLGLQLFAQKSEPVKPALGKATTEQVVSNHHPANWQLEQAIQNVLDGKEGTALTANPLPKNAPENSKNLLDYKAKKAAYIAKMAELESDAPSMGLAPAGRQGKFYPTVPSGKYPTDLAYAYRAAALGSSLQNGAVSFILNNPGSMNELGGYTGSDFTNGGAWVLGVWYATSYDATNGSSFMTISPTTGARTVIGNMGVNVSDLAYDYSTNTMYAASYNSSTASSSLYTVDMLTGATTLVGTMGSFIAISMGCDQNGNLYIVNINSDVLMSVNKTTGLATLIGSIGFNANYAQSMEFDNSDNTMYYACFNSTSFAGELRTVNLTTGLTTLIGTMVGGDEYCSLAIQNQPFIVYPNDVGIQMLLGPGNSMGLGASELISVRVKNYGSDPQTNVPLFYQLDGGTPVPGTITSTIPGNGGTYDYTFTQTGDFSTYGNHTLYVCTALPGDQATNNDCKTFTVVKIMPTWTDTIYPQLLPYWTGSTNGTSFTENSLIKLNSGNVEDGWAKFDIQMLPENTPISMLKLGYWVQSQTSAPYMQFRKLTSDPMASSPSVVMQQIQTGTQYISTTSGYTAGVWHVFDLPAQARTDLSAATSQDWFAIGFYEYESCVSCYNATIEGWAESHRPFLVATYGYVPGPDDVGVSAIISPVSGTSLTANEILEVSITNYGTVAQSNIPVSYTVNGGTPVPDVFPGPLNPGQTLPFQFNQPVNMFAYGTYSLHVCTNLATDAFVNNDCKNFFITNSIPTVTDTVWPLDLAYWTGSTNGTSFTQDSKMRIQGANVEDSWAKFNLSGIPNGVTLNSLNLHYYVEQQNIPYFRINRLMSDPMVGTPAQVMANITGGMAYLTTTSGYAVGWHDFELGAQARLDFTAQTDLDWFAVSFYEYESSSSWWLMMSGWAETNSPYCVINYNVPIPHDISVESINTPAYIVQGNYTVTATIRNIGTNPEYNIPVTCTIGSVYTCTDTIPFLAEGLVTTVSFDSPVWAATPGNYNIQVCAQLAIDMSMSNNCKSKNLLVETKLVQVYACNAYDPSGVLAEGPVTFFLSHPEVITQLAPQASVEFLSAGCWANGVWYVTEYSYSENSNLWTVNPATGAMTLIGPMGANMSGLTYDHTTGIMYAAGAYQNSLGTWLTNLYTVDMNTGASTLLNECGPIGLAINLACSQTGMLFFAEITNSRLWSYDPLSDILELMGPLGQPLNYAQDAEYDKYDNVCYFAGYTSSSGLYKVNIATGALTLIGPFQGGAEITGFAIPYEFVPQQVDLGNMWITHPTIGNLTNGEPIVIRVRNYGQDTVDCFDLSFAYNGIDTTENWCTWGYPPIAPGEYYEYAFSKVLNLSEPGQHCITTWISNVVGDTNQVNDTVVKCVNNVSCGLITCYPNSITEPESCGDDLNGGCYSSPEAFTDIINGDTYCGTLWKVDTMRDLDWYRFTLSSVKAIAVKTKSEFNLDWYLIKLPCNDQQVVFTKTVAKCTADSFFVNALQPGTYALVAGHNEIDFNTTCSANCKYTFNFQVHPARYCDAGSSYCDEYISHVVVGSINNASSCGTGGYTNYSALSTSMEVGNSYPITVTNGLTYYSSDQCGIWIDWNQDLDFDDVNEKIVPVTGSPGVGPYTATITVPGSALPGPTRLRVRICYVGNVDPCGISTYGEVEDYTVVVTAPIPPITTTVGSLNDPCPGTKIVPVTVDLFNNVNSLNLVLGISSGVTLLGYQNANSALATDPLTVTQFGSSIVINWFSITPATIGTGTLLELVLMTTSGTHQLVWDQGPDGCQYSSLSQGIIPGTYVNGTLTFGSCSDLSGYVIYKNPSTPRKLDDSTTVQLWQGTTLAYSATLNPVGGQYMFTGLNNGTYTLKAIPSTPSKKWGGGNANDALAILRHFVQMPPLLTGLNLKAADVNGSGGFPNAADALAVSRRFVGQITNFMPPNVQPPGGPDWYFEDFTITIDGTANQAQNLYSLCAGDVNGSYVPLSSIPVRLTPNVYLHNEGVVYLDNQVVDVPVYVENSMTVGAVSLVLDYPSNLEIVGVSVPNTPDNLVYTAKDGHLRLAWFSTDAADLRAGDVLITLQVKAKSVTNEEMYFFSTVESVLGNELGVTIEDASIMMPKLVGLNGGADYSLSNYPNPFSSTTEIVYNIPQNGFVTLKVYNVLGAEVATVVNAEQNAGSYVINFDGSKLEKGVYMYQLQVNNVTLTKSMVITE